MKCVTEHFMQYASSFADKSVMSIQINKGVLSLEETNIS